VREALFNILAPRVPGASALDPFAGSGALGFEALSRGAREVVFFEADSGVLDTLRANASRLGVGSRCRIVAGRAEILVARGPGGPWDLVLADPPYADPVGKFLSALLRSGKLDPEALVVVERDHRSPTEPPPPLRLVDCRRYGRTRLDFYCP
jgi:16S rRNA (guanine966-N2)-methyltransferase